MPSMARLIHESHHRQQKRQARGTFRPRRAELREFKAHALLIAERIDVREIEFPGRLASSPMTFEVAGGGVAVVFRYGAIVLFGVAANMEAAFIQHIKRLSAIPTPKLKPRTSKSVSTRNGATLAKTESSTCTATASSDCSSLPMFWAPVSL